MNRAQNHRRLSASITHYLLFAQSHSFVSYAVLITMEIYDIGPFLLLYTSNRRKSSSRDEKGKGKKTETDAYILKRKL